MKQAINRQLLITALGVFLVLIFCGWGGCKYIRTAGSPAPELAEEKPAPEEPANQEDEDFLPPEAPDGKEEDLPAPAAPEEEAEPAAETTPLSETSAPDITETTLATPEPEPEPVETPATVAPPRTATPGPDDAVRAFYQALNEKDCRAAMRLRPGYTAERCGKISKAQIINLKIDFKTPCEAVVYLKVGYLLGGAKQLWAGYLYCLKKDGRWIIDDKSFDSKTPRAEYQKKFVKYTACEETKQQPVTEAAEEPAAAAPAPKREEAEEPAPKALPIPTREELSFGSQAVLDACWTMNQLNGMPGDERTAAAAGDVTRPARLSPVNQPAAVPERWRDNIRRVFTTGGRKVVALTFNVGERRRENNGYDREIVNFLRANGVKATFFLGGKWMSTHPDKARQLIADPLFEIGNLAWSGGNFRMLNEREMREQVAWTQAQYEILREELIAGDCAAGLDAAELQSIPPVPFLFRFPYGTCNEQALKLLALVGLPTIQWDVVTADSWNKQTAAGIEAIIMEQAKSGSIIVCQADGTGHGTAEALSLVVPKLRAQGYQFVTVSELLRMGVADRQTECYEQTPGDNAKYDEAFGKGLD